MTQRTDLKGKSNEEENSADQGTKDQGTESSDTFLDLSKEDFIKLQQVDRTLDPIRKSLEETAVPNRQVTTKFFVRDGVIYRQWRPKDTDKNDVRLVEQLFYPTSAEK